MPRALKRSSTAAISLALWPTQVRCAMVSSPIWCLISETRSRVTCCVLPPAPYVTETKVGSSGFSSPTVLNNARTPSSVLGGKNSKEKTGFAWPNASMIRTRPPMQEFLEVFFARLRVLCVAFGHCRQGLLSRMRGVGSQAELLECFRELDHLLRAAARASGQARQRLLEEAGWIGLLPILLDQTFAQSQS